MPPAEASPAAGGGGVLGDEHGMAPHRGLAAVVGWLGWGEVMVDAGLGISHDLIHASLRQITLHAGIQPEPAAEG